MLQRNVIFIRLYLSSSLSFFLSHTRFGVHAHTQTHTQTDSFSSFLFSPPPCGLLLIQFSVAYLELCIPKSRRCLVAVIGFKIKQNKNNLREWILDKTVRLNIVAACNMKFLLSPVSLWCDWHFVASLKILKTIALWLAKPFFHPSVCLTLLPGYFLLAGNCVPCRGVWSDSIEQCHKI